MTILAAALFTVLASIVSLFYWALAAGMPWGQLAMGGRFPGRFPPRMRVVAVCQALFFALLSVVVLTRAGLLLSDWQPLTRELTWAIAAVLALGLIMNLATPSKYERLLWAPVAALMAICSAVAAASGG